MPAHYQSPQLIEYGSIAALTLGQTGHLPDYDQFFTLIAVGPNAVGCAPSTPDQVGCIVANGGGGTRSSHPVGG